VHFRIEIKFFNDIFSTISSAGAWRSCGFLTNHGENLQLIFAHMVYTQKGLKFLEITCLFGMQWISCQKVAKQPH